MAILSVGAIRGRQTWRIDTFRKSPRGSLVLSGGTKTWGRFSWVSSTPTCFCIRGSPELARAQHIPTWSSVRYATTYRRAKHRLRERKGTRAKALPVGDMDYCGEDPMPLIDPIRQPT